jgi:tRNA (cytidine/uridine-2'-O-)-methyltransferase
MKHTHERRHAMEFAWPVPPLNIALVEPEIPPNTGTIARLCAATGSRLHLIGQLGFRLTDGHLRRAGLDYWDSVDLSRHADFGEFRALVPTDRCFYFSTRATASYTAVSYRPGDVLVFGSESRGLSDEILKGRESHMLGIPMQIEQVRSLNLATAVAIVLYEALRSINQEASREH